MAASAAGPTAEEAPPRGRPSTVPFIRQEDNPPAFSISKLQMLVSAHLKATTVPTTDVPEDKKARRQLAAVGESLPGLDSSDGFKVTFAATSDAAGDDPASWWCSPLASERALYDRRLALWRHNKEQELIMRQAEAALKRKRGMITSKEELLGAKNNTAQLVHRACLEELNKLEADAGTETSSTAAGLPPLIRPPSSYTGPSMAGMTVISVAPTSGLASAAGNRSRAQPSKQHATFNFLAELAVKQHQRALAKNTSVEEPTPSTAWSSVEEMGVTLQSPMRNRRFITEPSDSIVVMPTRPNPAGGVGLPSGQGRGDGGSDMPLDHVWQFEMDNFASKARKEHATGVAEMAASKNVTKLSEPDALVAGLKERLKQLQQEETASNITRHVRDGAASQGRVRRGVGMGAGHGDAEELDRKGAEITGVGPRTGGTQFHVTKWLDVHPLPIDRSDTDVVSENDTSIPSQDLHLYQLFCYYQKMIIMIRPVSVSVPGLYAGTFFLDGKYCDALGQPIPQLHLSADQVAQATRRECRVRGKSINVSLKSSSYPPIDGLIPVNPALGKAYLDAQKREREIEDMILNAKGGVVTISLLKKLKAQRAAAGSLTQAFRRDIESALRASDIACAELMQKYKADLVLTVDKAAVSRLYIERFNEAQFLGTCVASWRGFHVYFTELDATNGSVLRNERDVPIFHIQKGSAYYRYLPDSNDIEKTPETDTSKLKPVQVVTHRMFFTSLTTQRIEEEPEAYLIGPDFDGLAYAYQDPLYAITLEEKKKWAEVVTKPYLIKSMGLVTDYDVEHVRQVRDLTEWKQNHGYEMGNVVKSQPITPGVYVVLTPEKLCILRNFDEIIGYYRTSWQLGIPFLLNPNWRVGIDADNLPRPYGEDVFLPLIDDCGYSALLTRFETAEASNQRKKGEAADTPSYETLKEKYVPLKQRAETLRQLINSGDRRAKMRVAEDNVDEGDLADALALVLDKKALAAAYFEVRRWQLLPRWFRPASEQSRNKDLSDSGASASSMERVMDDDDRPGGLSQRPPMTTLDPDFEAYRLQKEQEARVPFDELAECFQLFHPRNIFVAMLRDYLNPEPPPPPTTTANM